MTPSWRNWLQRLSQGPRYTRRSKERRRFRPTLEAFEDRTLLSTATHLAFVGFPGSPVAGNAISFTVEALDSSNNIDTTYGGIVHFTAGDSNAVLPANTKLIAGVGNFSATLTAAGNQALTVSASASNPTFALDPNSPFTNFPSTRDLISNDFNNDGKLDLAVTGSGVPTTVLLGNGNGTFRTSAAIVLGGNDISMVTSDLNGDGFQDLALADYGSTTAKVLLGNGNGTFKPVIGLPASGTNSIAVGDFNHDGKPDLALVNANGRTLFIFINQGNGTFLLTNTYAVNDPCLVVYSADFNNDGNYDLAIATANISAVQVWLSNGDGTFRAPVAYPVYFPASMEANDFNGDGKLDLAITNINNANTVSILLGNGDGSFQAVRTYPTGINPGGSGLAIGDINGDGKPDIVQGNSGSNSLTVLLGNGNGTFSIAQQILVGNAPGSPVIGDFNGDGVNDLAVCNTGDNSISVLLNQAIMGSATLPVSPAAATHFTVAMAGTAVASSPAAVTVTAFDQFNNVATGYTGNLVFTSSDTACQVPTGAALASGVGLFSVTFQTLGNQMLTVADSVSNTITGASPSIIVSGPATHLVVNARTSASAGAGFSFTVIAQDVLNNTAASYGGTIHFSSSDSLAVLPADATLASGIGIFSVTLKTSGSQSFTVNDSPASTITGSSSSVVISSGPIARFVLSGIPSNTAAGAPFVFTVAGQDLFGNSTPGYSGTVHFTLSDSQAALPANTKLTSGTGVFSATLKTAGTQTLTVADTATTSISGVSTSIIVAPASATHVAVIASSAMAAGNIFVFTVTAQDSFNNTDTNYSGTVHFTSSDTKAIVPTDAALSSGVGYFAAVLKSVGKSTLSAADVITPSISGGTAITVGPAAASHFGVTAPSGIASGNPFVYTVTALDPFNNLVTGYVGTVGFTSSDGQALLSVPGKLTSGTGLFGAILTTLGNQTITATDSITASIFGASNTIAVTGAPPVPSHFAISAPSNTTAGNAFVVVITAQDQFNHTAMGYNGTLSFTSSDTQATLVSNVTLSSGIGSFALSLKTAGSQTIAATDLSASSMSGTSNSITVMAASAAHLTINAALPVYPGIGSGPSSFATTGMPTDFTVTAWDPFGNFAATCNSALQFTSSDGAAGVILPAGTTLASGAGSFSAILQTPGAQTLTATDVTNSSLTGASSAIVTRGLVVTSFTPTPSGFIITFNKPFNPSTVLMYTTGTTPDDIILATAGAQVSIRGSVVANATHTAITFVKTDSVSSAGTFNPANALLAAGLYTLTLRSLTPSGNGFADSLGTPLDGTDSGGTANYHNTFSVSAPPVAIGLPDFARGPSNTDALFLPSSLSNGSTFTLSYTNPAASPPTGTATITFSTNAATLAANIQAALTSGGLATQIGINTNANNTPNSVLIVTNDLSTGANVLVAFQSALVQATDQLLSSSTAGVSVAAATINVANNIPGNGIPIALSSGLNVTSGTFTLQYNPSLLTMIGAVPKIAGASFMLVSNDTVTGTAVLSLSSPSGISSTAAPITLGSLLATVPFSATANYGAKQLLHVSNEQLAGTAGPITVTNADGLEVAAYFGDTTDTGGPLNLSDATAVATVANAVANTAAQTIPGFAAFPNLDPAIIGDASLQGNVNSTDAGAMTQEVGGNARITIPYAPIGLSVAPAGPGATLAVVAAQRTADAGTAGGNAPTSASDAGQRTSDITLGAVVDQVFAITSAAVRDLAVVPSPWGEARPHRLSNEELASLDKPAGGSLLGSATDLLNVTSQEGGDEDTEEATFGREAAQWRLFRF
jgi:FG-GAP-like repeat